MNITNEQLRNIIQEELEAVLNESTEQMKFRKLGKQDAEALSGLPTKEMIEKRMLKLNIPDDLKSDYTDAFVDNLSDSQYDHLAKEYPLNPRNNEVDNDLDSLLEKNKKKACKPAKGKRFAKRVNGKCRSYGQKGQAKGGGDRIRPGTKKGDAYCARSAKIKKCKNPPCANDLSRKKWKCRGSKSMK